METEHLLDGIVETQCVVRTSISPITHRPTSVGITRNAANDPHDRRRSIGFWMISIFLLFTPTALFVFSDPPLRRYATWSPGQFEIHRRVTHVVYDARPCALTPATTVDTVAAFCGQLAFSTVGHDVINTCNARGFTLSASNRSMSFH